MNSFKMVLFSMPLFFLGCVSFDPHQSEIAPVRQEFGATQVKIKFHDKDKVELGSPVAAYDRTCETKVNVKGLERNVCNTKFLGKGKIIKFYETKVALVEFDSSVQIGESSKFEVE